MKTVSILVPERAVPAAIADAFDIFTAVNDFFRSTGNKPFFLVQLVGLTKQVKLNRSLFVVQPDLLLHQVKQTDLIIIPAISGNIKQALKVNQDIIPWIIEQYYQGAEVASLCIGAFLLAATGLLNGKACSTHWQRAHEFRQMFPEVDLMDDRVICEQRGLYSSGGANAYWNLLLYLVEKYTNREMAIMASKYFLLDMEKDSQLPFTIFKGQKEHGDQQILSAQAYMESHYSNKITVEELAEKCKLGRRTFERRFKKATANSPVEYMKRVKIEIAKKQLEVGRKTVNEVMYEVGYTDPNAFRDVFKKLTGMSPIDYRNKYNKPTVH